MNQSPKVLDLYHLDAVSSLEEAYKAGIRGIIHKATEGATLTDPLYSVRREMAADTGILWGAYHFLRPGDLVGQAHRFVDEAAPTEQTLLAFDHEDPRVSLPNLLTFKEALYAAAPRSLVLYSGFLIKEQITGAHPAMALQDCRLWLAQYGSTPRWPSMWQSYWLWQYSESGTIPGIGNKVDVNYFAGTDEELAATWSGT